MKVNYHTHNNLCDGKGEARDYVAEAISRGFSVLGFSSHAPLKEDNNWTLKDKDLELYLNRIDGLKQEYLGQIIIYKGLEIDYYPDENRFSTFSKYNLDYSIGSVHMVKKHGFDCYFSVDESPESFKNIVDNIFGNIKDFTVAYYNAVRNMVQQGGFNIIGHLDLIKKFNKEGEFFCESDDWYINEVIKTLDVISRTDLIVEMNTGALSRGVQDTPYPSEWIIKECKKRDIKMCLNSDAHAPDGLECYFNESLEILRRCGYTELHTPFETINIRG